VSRYEWTVDPREPRGREAVPLPRFNLLGCGAGAHHAIRADTCDGGWLWVCTRCPAVREPGDPTWRNP
jgi:hypothetical protein